MYLSSIEQGYEVIYSDFTTLTLSSITSVDQSLDYGIPSDPFSYTFSTDESIKEIMISDDTLWYEHRHHSSFLDTIEDNLSGVYLPNSIELLTNSISIHEIDFIDWLLGFVVLKQGICIDPLKV